MSTLQAMHHPSQPMPESLSGIALTQVSASGVGVTETTVPEVGFVAMTPAHLPQVLHIEQCAHAHPWAMKHFIDVCEANYQCQVLIAKAAQETQEQVIAYCVAMPGVDEAHLLNLTVAPVFQRQGWGKLMLDALTLWARGQAMQSLWLEVRASNLRAQAVYAAHGFTRVGVRKAYYPSGHGQREDAWVMRQSL